LSDDDRPLRKSQDSGKDYLLCEKCEGRFNLELDSPAIHFLNNYADSIASKDPRLVKPEAELFQFIASVIWRAAVSDAPMYSGVHLEDDDENILRDSIFDKKRLHSLASVSVLNLIDYTEGGFSRQELRQVISCPAIFHGESQRRIYRVHAFSVEGFVMNFYMPRRGFKYRQKTHYLDAPNARFAARDVDIFSYEPIAKAMFASLDKEMSGNMTFKL
tara:strand:- start:132 stop:782 length:651 start_codon:yes stop_codon:yes gene_type:complete